MQQRSWWIYGLALATVATATDARAGLLHLGLPSGRTAAYVVDGSTSTRASAADLPDVGSVASPTFGDLDGDGDHDALVGEAGGRVRAFQNTGSDASPRWLRLAAWEPAQGFGNDAAPALGDLDGDGDLDLVVGSRADGLHALENTGGRGAPAWRARPAWALARFGSPLRATLGDLDGDGRADLVIGLGSGQVEAYRHDGAAFTRQASWDGPLVGSRIAPALGDLDGDGRAELVLTDGLARSTILTRDGAGWKTSSLRVADPGSGPAMPAVVERVGTVVARPTATPASGGPTIVPTAAVTRTPAAATPSPRPTSAPARAPQAALSVSPASGPAPLVVHLDARRSHDPNGDALHFAWDFGDGTASSDDGDPHLAIRRAKQDYAAAKATRNAGDYEDAVRLYLSNVEHLVGLTDVAIAGPVKAQGTKRLDRVARWYLQAIAHDLGGIYLWHSLGLLACERYATSLEFSREAARQAVLGGFPALPAASGTTDNAAAALQKLRDRGCAVPDPQPMFPDGGMRAGPVVVHEYATPGTYVATLTVTDGTHVAGATATIVVGSGGGTPPPPPPPPSGGGTEPYEGFGAHTRGGEGGREIRVREATDAAVRAAFKEASAGHAVLVFDVAGPITITSPLPRLNGSFITVEGNGATLIGAFGNPAAALVDVRGHDVIVRNLRVRNGGDNLRAQGPGAYNVVFSHVSSTGAADDGVSIGYGAHDVTVQYSFLAGNTRSLFLKYGATTNVSIHHTWILKQWIRGPLVSGSVMADLRNLVVEDWAGWGARFEADARGNVVNSAFLLGSYARSIGGKPNSALRLTQSGPVFTSGNAFEGLAQPGASGAASAPLAAPAVTTHALDEILDVVAARAGCLPRDAVDRAYITTETGWSVGDGRAYRPAGMP